MHFSLYIYLIFCLLAKNVVNGYCFGWNFSMKEISSTKDLHDNLITENFSFHF